MKASIKLAFLFILFLSTRSEKAYSQNQTPPRPRAINGYYFRNIIPYGSPSDVGFGVTVPAFINNDTLIDFYTTKIKYPQNNGSPGNYGNEISTMQAYINNGSYNFLNQTSSYLRDTIFILRDEGISSTSDLNNDGVNDWVFTGEHFHHEPVSAYFQIGLRQGIDVDTSSGRNVRRPNILLSNNNKLIDSIGYLDTLLLKTYHSSLVFDWDNDGKNDLVLSELGDGKTFQFWKNQGNRMTLSYPITETPNGVGACEGPFNIAAYDVNRDGFKDFIFSGALGDLYICFNRNGRFHDTSIVKIFDYTNLPVEVNHLAGSHLEVKDLNNDGNVEIIALFSVGSGTHDAIDRNQVKSIYKIIQYINSTFVDVTLQYFPTNLNVNTFYSNRQFRLIDIDQDGLIDLYPLTGDNGCTTRYPQGCGYFGYRGIDSTVYFKNVAGTSFQLKSLGLFFTDTAAQNIYYEFKSRGTNLNGYNLALGNQIVPFFWPGFTKPVFMTGLQKQSVEMYEGVIYSDSFPSFRNRLLQNSFLNHNFRPGFLLLPCEKSKPRLNSLNVQFCNRDSATLSIANFQSGDTIKWYLNSQLVNVGGLTQTFYSPGQVTVSVTDSIGCSNVSDVTTLTRNPTPTANFLVNSSSQCFTNNSFGFTNTSSIASGSLTQHAWSFGDGGTATTLNATRSYAAPGTYTVKLVSTSNEGCKDSTTQQVVVNPMPAAGYTINNNAQCLTGNNFGFTNTSSITTGSLTQHSWNFGDGGTATTLNATRSYTAPGTYTVKLVSTSNNGCKDSITQQVVVNPMPSTTFSINSAGQCLSGNSFTFTNNSVITTGSLTQHSWNFGDGGTATTLNATRSYSTPGTYTVKLVSTSNNGCKDSTTRSVTVHPMPLSIFSANTAIQCLTGNTFQFSNNSMISSGTLSSNWSFGNGATSTLQSPTHSYAAVGSYTVKLVSTSNNGCKDSTTRDMRVDPSPTATLSVGPYRSIHPGLLTTISATITPAGNYQYTWYRNNTAIPNETTTVVDSIGYRLWSGAYKMAVANTTPLLPCTYTTPEVVIGDSASARLFIYPSPNTGQFKVTYYSPANTRYQIVITDTKGAVLYRRQHEVTNRYQLIDINLTGASRGLYFLQVQDPSGVPLTSGKFVIH